MTLSNLDFIAYMASLAESNATEVVAGTMMLVSTGTRPAVVGCVPAPAV